MNMKEVVESEIVNHLTPEEIFDILKNRDGWFSSDYDDRIYINFRRPETDEERVERKAKEAQLAADRDAYFREQTRNRELKAQRKAIFKKWKRASPEYPEYVGLLKKSSTGPLTAQDTVRFRELNDLFNSERSRTNFYKFMGWEAEIRL